MGATSKAPKPPVVAPSSASPCCGADPLQQEFCCATPRVTTPCLPSIWRKPRLSQLLMGACSGCTCGALANPGSDAPDAGFLLSCTSTTPPCCIMTRLRPSAASTGTAELWRVTIGSGLNLPRGVRSRHPTRRSRSSRIRNSPVVPAQARSMRHRRKSDRYQ